MKKRAITLIELLVAVGVIAVLLAILLPSLSGARRDANSLVCKSNIRSLMSAILVYGAGADDSVIPAYNLKGVSFSVRNPLDGWGPILDKGNFAIGSREVKNNPFCCPNTANIAGMSGTQTGSNPENPKGYMEWPTVMTLSQVYPTTIPDQGFGKIIRVGYWINGDNPIGRPAPFIPNVHFTASVGYGPDPNGNYMGLNRFSLIKWPSRLIAIADGLYAGNQERTRLGDQNLRVGYRHPGRVGVANAGFADGHVAEIEGDQFPRKAGEGGLSLETIRAENLGEQPTLYSNPERDLAIPNNPG